MPARMAPACLLTCAPAGAAAATAPCDGVPRAAAIAVPARPDSSPNLDCT